MSDRRHSTFAYERCSNLFLRFGCAGEFSFRARSGMLDFIEKKNMVDSLEIPSEKCHTHRKIPYHQSGFV